MRAIELHNYTYTYPEAERCVLRGINLTIEAGECHCVSGGTGSGKTTLALAIKGLLPSGRQTGEIRYNDSSDSKGVDVGIVLQNPETQLLAFTIGAEAAFGLESLCVDPVSMPAMVQKTLCALGLDKPIDFETHKLSMGQKYRLLLASQLVMNRRLLVLDEPVGQLDPGGLQKLLGIIQELKSSGVAFLLLENRAELLSEAIDFFWHLNGNGAIHSGIEIAHKVRSKKTIPSCMQTGGAGLQGSRLTPGEQALTASGLTVRGGDGQSICSALSLSIPTGRRVAIYGENGAGKTTLVRCFMGFVRPYSGEVRVLGEKPVPGKMQGKVGCLFQNPEKQLFESTVFEEVAFSLKRFGRKEGGIGGKVLDVLRLFGIEGMAEFSPHKLSYGQRRLVALASSLASGPQLLILDDPLAGLDPGWCETILELLCSISDTLGTTIVLTSHDPAQLRGWADLVLYMKGGRCVAQ